MVRLVGAEETERERIAADIHDDSLQVMASAVLRLGMLARTLPAPPQQEAVQRVTLSIEAAIGRLRRLVYELNPPNLAVFALGQALPARAALSDGESPLTPREHEVLVASRRYATVAELAGALFLSAGTVRNHLSSAMQKLDARNRAEAVRVAEEKGWL